MNTSIDDRRRESAGFALVEMLIAMTVLSLVMAAAVAVLRSQSTAFRRGSARMELNQNMRYGVGTLDRSLRTLGSGVVPRQPMLVYAGPSVIVFNANYATDGTDIEDGNAVYSNPDLPPGATISMRRTAPMTIYGTAIQYPTVDYLLKGTTPSRAETIMFYFTPDATTADLNDFALMEQVNNETPELVARNIRAYPSRPFFEYWQDQIDAFGTTRSVQVPAASLPVRHTDPQHGSSTDIGPSALADSIKMIRVNLTVTNGATGTELMSRQMSTVIGTPNNGLVQLQACGDQPLMTGNLTAIPNLVGQPAAVRLQWQQSPDELANQKDVSQYNLYYRLAADPDWKVLTSVPQSGSNPYDITTSEYLVAGSQYYFAVAAQDCTPKESGLIATTAPLLLP